MAHCLDLGGLPDWFIDIQSPFTFEEMRGKDGVYECRFAESCLALQNEVTWGNQDGSKRDETRTNRRTTTMTLNWNPRLSSLCSIWRVMLCETNAFSEP